MTITLSSRLKPEVQRYFTDPVEMAQTFMKDFTEVMNFQREHRKKLTASTQKKIEMFPALMKRITDLEKEVTTLKEENALLKKLHSPISRVSPYNRLAHGGSISSGRITMRTPPSQDRIGYVPGGSRSQPGSATYLTHVPGGSRSQPGSASYLTHTPPNVLMITPPDQCRSVPNRYTEIEHNSGVRQIKLPNTSPVSRFGLTRPLPR